MKRVEYFNTKEELERYYENGVPSTVLAIVQPDAETPAVLYTSSNNSPVEDGSTEQQGGMIPPAGYILPEGTYDITANGLADISTYAYVDVNVSGGGVTPSGYAYVTTNGDHNVAAYEMVNVDVPIPAGYIKPAGFKSYEIPLEYASQYNINVATYAYAYIKNAYMHDYLDSLTYAYNILNGNANE